MIVVPKSGTIEDYYYFVALCVVVTNVIFTSTSFWGVCTVLVFQITCIYHRTTNHYYYYLLNDGRVMIKRAYSC